MNAFARRRGTTSVANHVSSTSCPSASVREIAVSARGSLPSEVERMANPAKSHLETVGWRWRCGQARYRGMRSKDTKCWTRGSRRMWCPACGRRHSWSVTRTSGHRARLRGGCAQGHGSTGQAVRPIRPDAAPGKDQNDELPATPWASMARGTVGLGSFDMLGFTWYWGKSRRGTPSSSARHRPAVSVERSAE